MNNVSKFNRRFSYTTVDIQSSPSPKAALTELRIASKQKLKGVIKKSVETLFKQQSPSSEQLQNFATVINLITIVARDKVQKNGEDSKYFSGLSEMPCRAELINYLTSTEVGLNEEYAQDVINICLHEGSQEKNGLFGIVDNFHTDSAQELYDKIKAKLAPNPAGIISHRDIKKFFDGHRNGLDNRLKSQIQALINKIKMPAASTIRESSQHGRNSFSSLLNRDRRSAPNATTSQLIKESTHDGDEGLGAPRSVISSISNNLRGSKLSKRSTVYYSFSENVVEARGSQHQNSQLNANDNSLRMYENRVLPEPRSPSANIALSSISEPKPSDQAARRELRSGFIKHVITPYQQAIQQRLDEVASNSDPAIQTMYQMIKELLGLVENAITVFNSDGLGRLFTLARSATSINKTIASLMENLKNDAIPALERGYVAFLLVQLCLVGLSPHSKYNAFRLFDHKFKLLWEKVLGAERYKKVATIKDEQQQLREFLYLPYVNFLRTQQNPELSNYSLLLDTISGAKPGKRDEMEIGLRVAGRDVEIRLFDPYSFQDFQDLIPNAPGVLLERLPKYDFADECRFFLNQLQRSNQNPELNNPDAELIAKQRLREINNSRKNNAYTDVSEKLIRTYLKENFDSVGNDTVNALFKDDIQSH